MKRLLIAIALLIASGIVAGIGLNRQFVILDQIEARVNTVRETYEAGDRASCAAAASSLANDLPHILEPLEIYLHHDKCYELTDIAAILPALLEKDENGGFLSELDRCESRLNHLRRAEVPSLGNIF